MLGALWGYALDNLTPSRRGENPQRNLPLASWAHCRPHGLYILATRLLHVLDPTTIAMSPRVFGRARGRAASSARRQVTLMAAGLMASSIGTLHTSILTGARVPYAMARDGLFFQNLARLNPKTRVPVGALAVQGLWACVLALSGSFDTLTDYVIFGSWIFYGLVTGSIFLFRRRMPNAERPYRAWGYPVVPVLFLLVTAFLLVNTLRRRRARPSRLLLIVLGLRLYSSSGTGGSNPRTLRRRRPLSHFFNTFLENLRGSGGKLVTLY